MMNEKVGELGLENTHFTNPTGLHDAEQYSTCHDIALILEYACRDEFMKTVLSTYEYTTAKTLQHPEGILLHSTMQTRLYGDEAGGMFIVGGKTGYTTEAKNCLASFAVKYDSDTESESAVYGKDAQYIFVTAYGGTVWAPYSTPSICTPRSPTPTRLKQGSIRSGRKKFTFVFSEFTEYYSRLQNRDVSFCETEKGAFP